MGKAHPATSFLQKQAGERILIIQTAKIGDLICSTPVFRAVKKKYPDAHLSVLVNPVAGKLLEYNPYINEIISLDNGFYKGFAGKMRLAKMFRNGRYDIVVSLNPNVPFTLAMLWGLVPVRVSVMPDPRLKPAGTSFSGITYRLASMFSTHLEKHIRGRLVVETYMEMLKAIGINDNDISKDVFKSPDADSRVKRFLNETVISRQLIKKDENLSPSPTHPSDGCPAPPIKGGDTSRFPSPLVGEGQGEGGLVGLAVTSGNRLKEWGAENISALTDKLITELGVKIILIGSEKDSDVSDKILTMVEKKNMVVNAVGRLSLSELPALIERLSFFVGVDTGVIYMADALNIPLVDIAGPSDMEDQRPTGKKVFIIQKKLSCVPCSHTFKAPYNCRYGHRKCITDITIEEVFEGVSKLLA
ncbi:MAG: glycosyltransferase family 9 protein [Deltaproteobacteria bacterium]|nr:glycosyltransferase family 9 protein [Deltaproteobacteria bacterium]